LINQKNSNGHFKTLSIRSSTKIIRINVCYKKSVNSFKIQFIKQICKRKTHFYIHENLYLPRSICVYWYTLMTHCCCVGVFVCSQNMTRKTHIGASVNIYLSWPCLSTFTSGALTFLCCVKNWLQCHPININITVLYRDLRLL